VSGADHRSTKHPRQVTCQACIALLGKRSSLASTEGSEAAAGTAP
jgi:hypothetical protein